MPQGETTTLARRVILGALLGGLLIASYIVLRPFLVPLAWAAILAYASWPLNRWLRRHLGGAATLSALLMTLLLSALFVVPLVWMGAMLREELAAAYQTVAARMAHGPLALPDFVTRIPWVGEQLRDLLAELSADPAALRAKLGRWVGQSTDELVTFAGGLGRNTAKLAISLLTVFFFYRDGEMLFGQLQRVLERSIGQHVNHYLQAAGGMIQAVVYGLLLTALAQGALAGLGYWFVGLDAPVLLGATTALVALIPFGAPLIWAPVGVWLLLTGELWAGATLLAWGALVVSWIDNLIRPFVISSATRMPFLLVMFGVLGGVSAFGLVGLFVGPVILAVATALWREWLEGRP